MILAPVSPMFPTNFARYSDDEKKLAPTNTYPEAPQQAATAPVAAARMPSESMLYTPPDSPVMRRSSYGNDLSSTMALIEQQVRLNAMAAAALSKLAPTGWLSQQLATSEEDSLRRNSNLALPQLPQQQQQQQQVLASSAPVSPGRRRSSKKYQLTENDIRPMDVLCGRGGKSNNHPGNKYYRQVIGEMREKYRVLSGKKQKTGLGYSIVDYIEQRGGRFLKKNGENMYTVLNKAEARRKTSQALRETKELKWTV